MVKSWKPCPLNTFLCSFLSSALYFLCYFYNLSTPVDILGIWPIFIDQYWLDGWSGQYHTGRLYFPATFPSTKFRLIWSESPDQFFNFALMQNWTYDHHFYLVQILIFIWAKELHFKQWCKQMLDLSHNMHKKLFTEMFHFSQTRD